MVGRFTKYNGATEVIDRVAEKTRPTELRRFQPDFYNPYRKPVRSPNLLQNRVSRTFGKRIVDTAAKEVARRAPLALGGPLGEMLALGLITWELYLLLLELQRLGNPTPASTPGTPDYTNVTAFPYQLTGDWQVLADPGYANGWANNGSPYFAVAPLGPGLNIHGSGNNYILPFTGQGHGFPLDYANGEQVIEVQEAAIQNGVTNGVHISTTYLYFGAEDGLFWTGEYVVGTGTTIDLPMDWAEPDPNMKRDFFPDGRMVNVEGPDIGPETDPKFKRGPRFRPPRPSRPASNTKERKASGPLKTILGAMDIISEASEFVGAIYDALPKDVRDKWDQQGRGLMDNAGQYGIDGADWKLNALWHNWHKVDIEQAIKNIIANELQDKVLGMYQRSLPKNIGHVGDAGSLALNDLINLFNDTIGLS